MNQPAHPEPCWPPSLQGYPLLGVLPSLLRDPLGYSLRVLDQHGAIVRLRVGPSEIYLVGHPQYAQHVLRDRSDNYDRGGMLQPLRRLLGNGLLASEGEFWLQQRRLIQPLFQPQRLAALSTIMAGATVEALAEWRPSARRMELFSAMTSIAMKIILQTMFGSDLAAEEIDEVRVALRQALRHLNLLVWTHSLPGWLPRPGAAQFQRAVQTIDRVIFRAIEARRHRPQGRSDLLSALLQAGDNENGRRMDDRQVRDEAMAFFIAGFETASTMLTWTLYLLCCHPAEEQRVRDEVVTTLGGKPPDAEALERLTYTKMVLKESLRVCSPSWMIPRHVVANDAIAGYRVRAGASVVILIHALHRHPDYWKEPQRFLPERFLPGPSAERHRCAFLPFGFGPHHCIGNTFALMEGQIVLALLMQRFRLRLVPGQRVSPRATVTYHPGNDLWVELEPA